MRIIQKIGRGVMSTAPEFNKMTAIELNDWYEHTVGYRPQIDDPTMADDDLRKLCRERWDAEFGASS